jgi:ABC-2 type transport system permease protein/lipopolysaccharide transport system permease protein
MGPDEPVAEGSRVAIPTRIRPEDVAHDLLDAPPPDLRWRRSANVVASIKLLWPYRELLRSLTERQLRSRYKQAILGFVWALATPVSLMLVFIAINSKADIDTGGVPYSLFSFIGLLAWTFFTGGVNGGATSLLGNTALLTKTNCPRELFPFSTIVVAAVDTAVAGIVLVVLFLINGFAPKPTTVYVPILMLVQLACTTGLCLLVAILIVYLRDLRYALGLFLQIGLLATPIAYGLDVIPANLRWLYCLLNPLAPVIDGYRRTVLQNQAPQWGYLGLGAITSAALLALGFWVFKRWEGGVVDYA